MTDRVLPGANWIAAGAILLFGLIGYGQLLAPDGVPVSPYSDFVAEHLATQTVLHRSLQAGQGIPFWRSDQFSGYTWPVSPQSQVTSPLNALFLWLPPEQAVGPTFFLLIIVAALSFYLLGAALGLGFWPRLLMATAGMFSFKLVMALYAGWLPIMPAIVLIPMQLAAVIHLCDRPGPAAALALALAAGLGLHAGHLQLGYYTALLSGAYLLYRLVPRLRLEQTRPALATTAWLALGGALALGLAACRLLPLAADGPWLSRPAASWEFHLAGSAIGLRHLLTFLLPEALGTPLDGSYPGAELWEHAASFGAVPLTLAAIGAVLGWRRRPTRFLVAAFLVSLILAMDTPLGRLLFQVLPGYSLFRLPGRWLFITAVCGIGLAGIGLELLLARLARAGRPAWMLTGAAGVLIGLIGLEGGTHARRYVQVRPLEEVAPTPDYQQLLAAGSRPHRIAPLGRHAIPYGWAARLDLQLISGYDPYNYRLYAEYMDLLQFGRLLGEPRIWVDLEQISRWDLLAQLDVEYLVSRQALPPEDRGPFTDFARLEDQPVWVFYQGLRKTDLHIYRDPAPRARVRFAGALASARSEDELLALMKGRDLNLYTPVLDPQGQLRDQADPTDSLELLAWAPGDLSFQTRTRGPRVVLVSELFHPGWRATSGQVELPVARADWALMAVAVPAGEHRVTLSFRPPLWTAGLVVQGLAGLAFLGLAGVALRRWRRRRRAAEPAVSASG